MTVGPTPTEPTEVPRAKLGGKTEEQTSELKAIGIDFEQGERRWLGDMSNGRGARGLGNATNVMSAEKHVF